MFIGQAAHQDTVAVSNSGGSDRYEEQSPQEADPTQRIHPSKGNRLSIVHDHSGLGTTL